MIEFFEDIPLHLYDLEDFCVSSALVGVYDNRLKRIFGSELKV